MTSVTTKDETTWFTGTIERNQPSSQSRELMIF